MTIEDRVREHLANIERARDIKDAELDAMTLCCIEEQRTFDAAEAARFDSLSTDVADLKAHLVRLRKHYHETEAVQS